MSNKQIEPTFNDIYLESLFEELVGILKQSREGEVGLSIRDIAEALNSVLKPEELNSLIQEIERIIIK